jgi:predicted nucleic acid-binding protein
MEPVFVDASVFIEFLSREDEGRYERARGLFERAEAGRVRLETTELVVCEVARALGERGLKREEAQKVLDAILGTRNLKAANRDILRRAVEIYGASQLDFACAYHIAWLGAKGRGRVATFEPRKFEGRGLEVL